MLARLRRVKPFAVQETMVPAAAFSPAAQIGIERYLITGRVKLGGWILRYIRWLRARGATVSPENSSGDSRSSGCGSTWRYPSSTCSPMWSPSAVSIETVCGCPGWM